VNELYYPGHRILKQIIEALFLRPKVWVVKAKGNVFVITQVLLGCLFHQAESLGYESPGHRPGCAVEKKTLVNK
jgi:hypothetical protein